jgi:hypothetical protein
MADSAARYILAREPDREEMLDLLGKIAAAIGYHEEAFGFFDRVLTLSPSHPTAARDRESARTALNRHPPCISDATRYLVIRPWRQGFWSDVTHLLGCLLLAEITGRIPVTLWDRTSLYSDGSRTDAFELYFKPLPGIAIEDVELAGAYLLPSGLVRRDFAFSSPAAKYKRARHAALAYLARQQTVAVSDFYVGILHLLPWIPKSHVLFSKSIDEVYRWLAAKYLRPRDDIAGDVDRLAHSMFAVGPHIAVHFRGLDKQREYRAVRLDAPRLEDYFEILDRHPPSTRIFLLSDDDLAMSIFRARYGERIACTPFQRGNGEIGLHHRQAREPVRLGREVMIDTYLALRCDTFLGWGYRTSPAWLPC